MATLPKHSIESFTDLEAWQQGHGLALEVYEVTRVFPKEEQFGLASQMRRCIVSVTSNIAEGFSRSSKKEKLHFYSITQGSLTELQNQLLIARDTGMIEATQFSLIADQSVVVRKLVFGLAKSLRK